MTFCPHEECSKFKICIRAFTQEVEEEAKEIGLPVCYFSSKPECFVALPKGMGIEFIEKGGENE
jgi:hypothetical protein